MTYAETLALRTALRADDFLQHITFVSSAEEADADPDAPRALLPPPYVLIHPGGGTDNQDRVTGPYVAREPSFTLHCVGESALAAELVLENVDRVLRPGGLGITLAVPGRRVGRLRRTDVGPVLDDDSSRPAVWYVPAMYRFRSSPGASRA